MNELKNILEQNLNDNFISAVLSNPRDEKLSAKVKVRPVLMKDTRVYQMETFRGNQAFHENLSADEACEKMLEAMENMKQMQLVTADAEFSVLISKKGKVTIKKQGRDTEIKTLEPIDTRVLYLNMTNIYPMYTQQLKGEAFSLQSLNTYFESNEAYIGKVRSTRYRWQEVKEVPKGDILANPAGEPTIDNSMKRIMVNKESNTSAVCFNYDILRDLLDVDFERDVQNYDQTPETEPGFRF